MRKEWQEAFQEGFQNPNSPLSPGEQALLRRGPRAGPRIILIETDEPEEAVATSVAVGELTHSPTAFSDDDDVVDAEIIE